MLRMLAGPQHQILVTVMSFLFRGFACSVGQTLGCYLADLDIFFCLFFCS